MKRPSLHRKALAALSPRHGDTKSPPHAPRGGVAALTVGALGIVYGDIGTSPLYAMDQLFFGRAEAARTPADVLGGVSLVIWTITIIVAFKYAILVLRAQNDGEGGVFALYGLLSEQKKRGTTFLLWSLMLGAGLLFGDGIITPAISVLSAVEGLQVATPALGHTVIPITVGLSDHAVRHPVQGHGGHRHRVRSDSRRLVCRHRRARRAGRSSAIRKSLPPSIRFWA